MGAVTMPTSGQPKVYSSERALAAWNRGSSYPLVPPQARPASTRELHPPPTSQHHTPPSSSPTNLFSIFEYSNTHKQALWTHRSRPSTGLGPGVPPSTLLAAVCVARRIGTAVGKRHPSFPGRWTIAPLPSLSRKHSCYTLAWKEISEARNIYQYIAADFSKARSVSSL